MTKSAWICGAAALVVFASTRAEDYPLTFKTIPAKEVLAFPGGYGAYAQVRLAKPKELKKEPKAVSQHPLYGIVNQTGAGIFVMRLDESKGDGKGYDTLLVDMNQNGDLTDEKAGPHVTLADEPKPSPGMAREFFGPFQAPADKAMAGGRPVYFVQVQIYNMQQIRRSDDKENSNQSFGSFRLKAGWYLEAQVALGPVKQKVGLFDANTNLRLGDPAKGQTSQDGKNWYFSPGDAVLVDADNSGSFERDPFNRESCSFGPLLYFGSKPCQITLAVDCKSLRVEPCKEPLAEVTLAPKGDQVQNVSLAWEKTEGDWQLIRAGAISGKIQVPPGNYRLYATTLLGKSSTSDPVMVSGYQRKVQTPSTFASGQANTLKCGAPLDVKVEANRRTPESWESSRLAEKKSTDSDYVLTISTSLNGAGGEVYSSYGKGEKFEDQPSKPAFTVTDSGGKAVGNGNLEYG